MFILDERLKKDTIDCGSWQLCKLLLMNTRTYPWFILVPRREGVTEIHHLNEEDRLQFWEESQRLSLWLEGNFIFTKLNVAALGNIVRQLHLHHVCRSEGDPAWPGPVWGHAPALPYADDEAAQIVAQVQKAFPELVTL